MRYGLRYWLVGGLGAGLALVALGCHGKKQTQAPLERYKSPALADKAATVISAVCTRQSYATASVGLIAGETNLREDVFELRDPMPYRIVPYRLGATVRLEDLLRRGAEAAGVRRRRRSVCGSLPTISKR